MPKVLLPAYPPKDKYSGFITGHLRQFSKGRYRFMQLLEEKYGTFVELRFGRQRTFLLTDLEGVEFILKKAAHKFSKDTPGFRLVSEVTGKGIFTESGESWLKIRKIIQPFFSKQQHELWSQTVQMCSLELIEQLKKESSSDSPINISHYMTKIALSVLGRTFFNENLGLDISIIENELSKLVALTDIKISEISFLPTLKKYKNNREFKKSIANLDRLINKVIEQSKLKPRDPEHNLTHALLNSVDGINNQFIVDQVKTMVFAGHETTSSVLSWTLYLLTKHPDWLFKVENEIKEVLKNQTASYETMNKLTMLNLVVNESMRLYPPNWSIGRKCEEDVDFFGYPVKKGDIFIISPFLIHHNAKSWFDPELFDPERFLPEKINLHQPLSFIPFGVGPRACIGEVLARIELMIIISSLIQNFKLSLPPHCKVEPDFLVSLRPHGGIPLIMKPRNLNE